MCRRHERRCKMGRGVSIGTTATRLRDGSAPGCVFGGFLLSVTSVTAATVLLSGTQGNDTSGSRRPDGPAGNSNGMSATGKVASRWIYLLGLLASLGSASCSRQHYHKAADTEVTGLVAEKAGDPRWA